MVFFGPSFEQDRFLEGQEDTAATPSISCVDQAPSSPFQILQLAGVVYKWIQQDFFSA